MCFLMPSQFYLIFSLFMEVHFWPVQTHYLIKVYLTATNSNRIFQWYLIMGSYGNMCILVFTSKDDIFYCAIIDFHKIPESVILIYRIYFLYVNPQSHMKNITFMNPKTGPLSVFSYIKSCRN